ncbi:hypothetical protein C4568_02905 [Candidatus Parcubacteria bacterium]|nr:MAG: hypothetical protein C4568_02905 [Candidatus Parcubacteria bacterium]
MDNILTLHRELKEGTYKHGSYKAFKINDPKPRDIHKATVRDRLVHHAIYRQLYQFFDRTFIADSYSCRQGKGTHKALNRFREFAYKVSRNHTKTCWVLKCDIKKFFASIDQTILLSIISLYTPDQRIKDLIKEIMSSFCSCCMTRTLWPIGQNIRMRHKGLPLGNLTSQLLVNVYMNEFDQYMKHKLKAKHYIRYADDFVILSRDKQELQRIGRYIALFLRQRLKLELHPDKVFIKTFASGVDFLGWIHFPDHRVLRTSTKRRMVKRTEGADEESPTLRSYLGLLKHGNAGKLSAWMRKAARFQ